MLGKWESLERCFVKLEWFCDGSKDQKLQKSQLELFGDYIPVHTALNTFITFLLKPRILQSIT